MNDELLDTARLALACLDLTSLNDNDEAPAIEALCARAVSAYGPVAAVCVWPRFVARARRALPAAVRVAAVANFPQGALDTKAALADAAAIADAGGNEIDLVLPWRAWAAGQKGPCTALVAAVRRAHPGLTLKLILESGELHDPALIAGASTMALDEGVDFLKTSTGKTPVSATPAAAGTMLAAIAVHASRGHAAGFKASGGIRSVGDAKIYIDLTRDALGSVTPQNFRLGASSLMNDILARLSGAASSGTAPAPSSY
jgi:deoxyribose-phosphate aldolase